MKHFKLFTLLAAMVCAVSMWADVAINGKLPCAFSVSSTKQVWFSQGNLRATTSNNGSSWTWSFAEHQYDYIGSAEANTAINDNGTVSSNGTVDLFGWSTAATYYGIHNSISSDYSGDFVDWGTNAITNGGNEANAWRTLTKDEWVYLFYTRTSAATLFGLGSVNGVNGTILLPDDWTLPAGASFTASTTQGLADQGSKFYNSSENNFFHNTYTVEQWSVMEAAGAVFLPAAGDRYGTDVRSVGSSGYFWSATLESTNFAYTLYFNPIFLNPQDEYRRPNGLSVRLVSETAPTPAPSEINLTAYQDPINTLDYYSTFFSSSINYELSAGAKAYVATISEDALILTKIAEGGQVIPADNAVILKATGSAITLTPSNEDPVTFTAINNLLGVDVATATPANCYVLSGEGGEVGFYRYIGAQVGAHKAYIQYGGGSAPRRMRFVFNEENAATGIDPVTGNPSPVTQKLIQNGQLIILRDGVRYNAQGQIIK